MGATTYDIARRAVISSATRSARPAAAGGALPAGEALLRASHHGGGEAGDPLAVECRLRKAALPSPEVALAGEEALTDQDLHPPDDLSLHVVLVVVLEDVLDGIGVEE